MTDMTLTIEGTVHIARRGRGGRPELREGPAPADPPPERVPRVARLMALAIKLEALVRTGVVRDYAELARLGRVTRARVTQVMNLTLLAPDIQEALLFLPPVTAGREPLTLGRPTAGGGGPRLAGAAAGVARAHRRPR